VPFPGRLLLVGAGAIAGDGQRDLFVIIALGTVAAIAMDHVWYVGGRLGSTRLLGLYRRLAGSSAESAAVDYFKKYGAATIVMGRFFTSVRALAWPVASAHGIGYPKFLLLDVLAAVAWTALWVLLGWAVGERWRSVAEDAGPWVAVAGVVALAAVVAPIAMRARRRRARRRAARAI
jgi:membrane protein DedA with SNARE-associated domain